jgi:polyisoprenoid-binding protein YceI
MSTHPATTNAGTYKLGPENGTLSVRTERTGAAAKAGHNLLIHVTSWQATLVLGGDSSLSLDADSTSLRVIEGSGGMKGLDDGDKDNINKTINDEVLKGKGIEFRSTAVEPGAGGLRVKGDLTLLGKSAPVEFDVAIGDDGKLTGTCVVKQTNHKMKPYSAMFGALKVVDEVTVEIDGQLPTG